MGKLLSALIIVSIALSACNSYGDKLKVNDKSEVYYKDGATSEDAKKLGDYLLKEGYFDSTNEKSVQLSKTKDTFNVKFVVDKKRAEASLNETEATFTAFGMLLSMQVFDGKPTKVMLADPYMKTFREIPTQTLKGSPGDSLSFDTGSDTTHEVK
jgi:hypothetical protein